jgi:hypothetical protein
MKMYGEADVEVRAFTSLMRDGGEWLALSPGRFTPVPTE